MIFLFLPVTHVLENILCQQCLKNKGNVFFNCSFLELWMSRFTSLNFLVTNFCYTKDFLKYDTRFSVPINMKFLLQLLVLKQATKDWKLFITGSIILQFLHALYNSLHSNQIQRKTILYLTHCDTS